MKLDAASTSRNLVEEGDRYSNEGQDVWLDFEAETAFLVAFVASAELDEGQDLARSYSLG